MNDGTLIQKNKLSITLSSCTWLSVELSQPENVDVPDVIDAAKRRLVIRWALEPALQIIHAFVNARQASDSEAIEFDDTLNIFLIN